ncbi:MAG: amidophosphoribosyltransferase [Bacteroidetes bacterium]|nr:amidophosphoribosyltransferase [Bacteroidota bacterium]MBL6964213.1 amidophosphoribosyltransferase [Bacteroidota bacterium]
MIDSIKHECGIALIRLRKPISFFNEKYKTPLYGLNKLYVLMEKQHNRGQDGAGIGVVNFDLPHGKQYMYRNRSVSESPIMDLFNQMHQDYSSFQSTYALNDVNVLKGNLPFIGELMLGHLRYGTHGGNDIRFVHPVYRPSNYKTKSLMLAGNFNMTNNDQLFNRLVEIGQFPISFTDTITVLEKIGHFLDSENEHLYQQYKQEGFSQKDTTELIAKNLSLEYILTKSAKDFDGGYAIAGLIGHGDAFVLRDPSGIRPAFYYMDDEIVVVASEKPAIRTAMNLPSEDIHEVEPGNALIIKMNGEVSQIKVVEKRERKSCSFERIYFSRGTDEDIYRERKKLGKYLAPKVLREIHEDIENTIFSFIPNTAEVAFLGLIEGLNDYLDEVKKVEIMAMKDKDAVLINKVLSRRVRVEKMAVKDTKIRTFITEDTSRTDLVSHVYDSTYGIIRTRKDSLVVLDDSVVRGTTLKESIISLLDRLEPKKIIVVSSAPQIRYPDCYGIDMSKLQAFVAFKAAIELLKDHDKEHIIRDVYRKCKEETSDFNEDTLNHVKEIYQPFSAEQVSQKIAELVKPDNMRGELSIIFQDIDTLHRAIPDHLGDWYFTGNYPTPGGNKVANQSFVNYFEGKDKRAY